MDIDWTEKELNNFTTHTDKAKPLSKLKIYTAGKLSSAQDFIDLASQWPEFDFISSWTWVVKSGIPDTEENAPEFWALDFADIRRCDVLMVVPGNGTLRGALVECGFALACGKPVICVGKDPGFGTWQYANNVFRVPGLPEARMLLLTMGVKS